MTREQKLEALLRKVVMETVEHDDGRTRIHPLCWNTLHEIDVALSEPVTPPTRVRIATKEVAKAVRASLAPRCGAEIVYRTSNRPPGKCGRPKGHRGLCDEQPQPEPWTPEPSPEGVYSVHDVDGFVLARFYPRAKTQAAVDAAFELAEDLCKAILKSAGPPLPPSEPELAALSEPVTPPTREESTCDCWRKNITCVHAAMKAIRSRATPSPAPEPVGWTCCEATREAAAKVLDERAALADRDRAVSEAFELRVCASKLRSMPLPAVPPATTERAERAEAERDALKARVAELERVISKSEPNK